MSAQSEAERCTALGTFGARCDLRRDHAGKHHAVRRESGWQSTSEWNEPARERMWRERAETAERALLRFTGPAAGDEPVAERDALLAQIEEAGGREQEWRALAVANARRAEEADRARGGAYRERNQVVALMARMALTIGWRAGFRAHEPDPDPAWDNDWKNVAVIDLPTGQVTWHYHDSDRPLFASLPPYPDPWDGHDTSEKYRRVNAALAKARGDQ